MQYSRRCTAACKEGTFKSKLKTIATALVDMTIVINNIFFNIAIKDITKLQQNPFYTRFCWSVYSIWPNNIRLHMFATYVMSPVLLLSSVECQSTGCCLLLLRLLSKITIQHGRYAQQHFPKTVTIINAY